MGKFGDYMYGTASVEGLGHASYEFRGNTLYNCKSFLTIKNRSRTRFSFHRDGIYEVETIGGRCKRHVYFHQDIKRRSYKPHYVNWKERVNNHEPFDCEEDDL